MTGGDGKRGARYGNVILGAVLIVLGILFMLGRLFDIRLSRFVWPFYVIAPGVLVLILALAAGGSAGKVLVGLGSVVSMTGLLLLYQNTFDHFESWAYAWALVVPTSIGLGQVLYGTLRGERELVRDGRRMATTGIVIFLVGAAFFELIIGISGFGLRRLGFGPYVWPILLIGLGVIVLIRSRRRPEASGAEAGTGAAEAEEDQG